jgi:hypothetical protein
MVTLPAGPQLDSGPIRLVSIIRKVKILFGVRNTDPVSVVVLLIVPNVPNVGFRPAYDPLPVLRISFVAQVCTLLGIPDLPSALYLGKVPLLIGSSMARPTLYGFVVTNIKIDDGSRLLVNEDVAHLVNHAANV